jgi:hypothetical protein
VQKKVLQTSLRAALFAPRSNPESAVRILDCFGAKGAPRNDGLKQIFAGRSSMAAHPLWLSPY